MTGHGKNGKQNGNRIARTRYLLLYLILLVVGVMLVGTVSAAAPMGYFQNNDTYINITTYDGSNQPAHPSVEYTETAWNGYHYLMAFTPYPDANNSLENPSMRYSNDKVNWEMIAGQPDPIVSGQGENAFTSDPNLELVGSTLYLFYHFSNTTAEPDINYYNRTSTTDGVTWTTPTMLIGMNDTRSTSFIYNGTAWQAFGHDTTTDNVTYFESADGITFTEYEEVTGISIGSYTQWHSEVKLYDGEYQMLMQPYNGQALFYFNSTTGRSWVNDENNPVAYSRNAYYWDSSFYKSSFVESGGAFDIWYGGTLNYQYHVAYASVPITPLYEIIVPSTCRSIFRAFSNSTFDGLVTGDGTTISSVATTFYSPQLKVTATTGAENFSSMYRTVCLFNIPDGVTVTSATFQLEQYSVDNQLGNITVAITNGSVGDISALNMSDYQRKGNTELSDREDYNNGNGTFVFNAAGLDWLNQNTTAVLFIRSGDDVDNSYTGGVRTGLQSYKRYHSPTATILAYRPHLDIVYTVDPVTPEASFTANVTSGILPLGVAFTDTSTNTPTMWNYSWGDGNWTNGTQDVTHLYEFEGVFDAFLIASNAAGTNTSANTTITVLEATPPASITNLANATTCNSINWTWTNPADADFNHTIIYQDGIWLRNASNTTTFDLWGSLAELTNYTISTKTVDIIGNVNVTWVNQTAQTDTCATPTPTSSSAAYAVSNDFVIAAMMILGICPIIAGIGLAMYGLSGSGTTGRSRAVVEDNSTYLMAGVISIVIGVAVLVVIFMLMPVFAGAAEGII